MNHENLHTTDCIRTFSGLYMNVFEPTPEMICIDDIAHALSYQCRFGGHLPRFYSVAQHSVHCSNLVPTEYKLQALMHDASEAYLLDIPSPIKKHLAGYKEMEDRMMKMIANKFGFDFPLEETVKDQDAYMLQMEWEQIMLANILPCGDKMECWKPEESKEIFLYTFHALTKEVFLA